MRNALFPKTLYLPERAAAAMKSLSSIIDPESGLPFCLFDIMSDPPKMEHTCFDWSDHTARVIDALLLARALTGSEQADDLIIQLFSTLEQGFGEENLHFTPDNEWTSKQANMHYQRSVINALISLCLEMNSDKAEIYLRKLIKGLYKISVKREDFWYFPAVEYLPGGWFRGDWKILGYGTDPANTNGRLLFGLCRAWELTKCDEAAFLAEKYVKHIIHHSSAYMPDGSFATGMEFREGHFHSRAVTLLGVIRYAYTFGSREALEWGKRVYEKALSYGTTFGWYPERLVKERAHGCETCAVVDMMEAAIWLAKCGFTEYWEVAERILRNQLVSSQVRSLEDMVKAREHEGIETHDTSLLKPFVGGFAGWSEPNDLLSKVMHNWDLYLCCCAQGVRGFFNAWTNAVEKKGDSLCINLLINYMDSELQVCSWLPDSGKLTVLYAHDTRVDIRIPDWIKADSLRVSVGLKAVNAEIIDNYISIFAYANELVSVVFEVDEKETTEQVLETNYHLKWKGNQLISISPRGQLMPLYTGVSEETNVLVNQQSYDVKFTL